MKLFSLRRAGYSALLTRLRFVALGLVATLVYFVAGQRQALPDKAIPATAAPLLVSVKASQPRYMAGQPICITVALTNHSVDRVRFGYDAEDLNGFGFTITRPDGSEAPQTAINVRIHIPPTTIYAIDPLVIDPGHTRTYTFDLNALFDMSLAGHYRVQVTRFIRIPPPRGSADDAPYRQIAVNAQPLVLKSRKATNAAAGSRHTDRKSAQRILSICFRATTRPRIEVPGKRRRLAFPNAFGD